MEDILLLLHFCAQESLDEWPYIKLAAERDSILQSAKKRNHRRNFVGNVFPRLFTRGIHLSAFDINNSDGLMWID